MILVATRDSLSELSLSSHCSKNSQLLEEPDIKNAGCLLALN